MLPEHEIQQYIELGLRNREVTTLVEKWCVHARLVVEGGVGLLEQQTGLPIAGRRMTCDFERATGWNGMDLAQNALDYHDRNCVGCPQRQPVGLPNLGTLVQQRDEEARKHQQARIAAEKMVKEGVAGRTLSRSEIRTTADHAVASVLLLLDAFDEEPTAEKLEPLLESVTAVPNAFDSRVESALVDVAEAGGESRTGGALQVLSSIAKDRQRLASVSLRALGRGDALEVAGTIAAQHLDQGHFDLIKPAIQALMWLAGPVSSLPFLGGGREALPEGLVAAHRVAADDVEIGIRKALRSPRKEIRRAGAYAVLALLQSGDSAAGVRFSGDLIASFTLPDDPYDQGEAASTVAWVLAEAFRHHPEEIDDALQRAIQHGGSLERKGIFKAYLAVFDDYYIVGQQRPRRKPLLRAERHERIAFAHILSTFAQLPAADELLQDLTAFIERPRALPWDLRLEAIEALLGTAALAGDQLYRPSASLPTLEDPRPEQLKELERVARRALLGAAVRASMKFVVQTSKQYPDDAGRRRVLDVVLGTFDRLPENAEQFRSQIVAILGELCENPSAATPLLPRVYTSLTDRSQLVRASAARAYESLVKLVGREALPSLLHGTFLILLEDPYVIVHTAALRALEHVSLPDEHLAQALESVIVLVGAYEDSERRDILALAVSVWLRISRRAKALTSGTKAAAVRLIRKLKPYEAVHLIRYGQSGLRDGKYYGDLVLDLLVHPESFDTYYSDLMEELESVPAQEVIRLSPRLVEVAKALPREEIGRQKDFLQLLTAAESWGAALQLSRDLVEAQGTTRSVYPARLRLEVFAAAVALEEAALRGRVADVIVQAQRVRTLQGDIASDDDEHREIRGVFPPVRPAPGGD